LAIDENVWAFAAVAIVQDGLNAIQRRADDILVAEARGRLASPAWLALCRCRVAEVTGSAGGPGAAGSSAATATLGVGAQPPGTAAAGLAWVRALTEIAAPCRAGN
jgi:hypothetical protein